MTKQRSRRDPPDVRLVIVLAAVLLAYNSTAHLLPARDALYVPVNVAAAAILWMIARQRGLHRSDLGLEPDRWRSGLAWGTATSGVVVAALIVIVVVPPLHPLLDDARVGSIGSGLVAYRALIRIPLGTALFEEFAFRGVLFGAWAKVAGIWRAAAGSSIVFGLWHIRPTIDLLDANSLAGSAGVRVAAVAAAVIGTAAVGGFFCLVRLRSRSLLAPFVAHAMINSAALVAAAVVING